MDEFMTKRRTWNEGTRKEKWTRQTTNGAKQKVEGEREKEQKEKEGLKERMIITFILYNVKRSRQGFRHS